MPHNHAPAAGPQRCGLVGVAGVGISIGQLDGAGLSLGGGEV